MLALLLALLLLATFECGGALQQAGSNDLLPTGFVLNITATSAKLNFPAEDVIIRQNTSRSAWCPREPLQPWQFTQWLTITFTDVMTIDMLKIEPRKVSGYGEPSGNYTRHLVLQFRRSLDEEFRNYTDQKSGSSILEGVNGVSDRKYIQLEPALKAKQVRLLPLHLKVAPATVCLRAALLSRPSHYGVVSYSAPKGDGQFVDSAFNGNVGLLTDLSHERSVGWQRQTVTVDFRLDRLRRLRRVIVNGTFDTFDVACGLPDGSFGSWRVLTPANVRAGGAARREEVDVPDEVTDTVRVRLHRRAGSRWLLVSEVHFLTAAVPAGEQVQAADSEMAYALIAGSSLLAACLLLAVVGLLCLRRRHLRKRRSLRACDAVHLDFGSGRPAVLQSPKTPYDCLPADQSQPQEAREYASLYTLEPPPSYSVGRMSSQTRAARITANPLADAQDSRLLQQMRGQLPHQHARTLVQKRKLPPVTAAACTLQGFRHLAGDSAIRGCCGTSIFAWSSGGSTDWTSLSLPPSSVSLQDVVGVGEFGEVRLAEVATAGGGLRCVAKLPQELPGVRSRFWREQEPLAACGHPHVIRLVGVLLQPPTLLQEHPALGDLHSLLRRVADCDCVLGGVVYLAEQVAAGMEFLEDRGICHRDLACRNCLLDGGFRVKIGDVASAQAKFCGHYDAAGLPVRWMAWEAALHATFSTSGDAWSFAVTLWEMLTLCRQLPFAELSDAEVLANCRLIFRCEPAARPLDCPAACPREVFDLLAACWQRDAACRPRFKEVRLFLQRKTVGFAAEGDPLLSQLANCW